MTRQEYIIQYRRLFSAEKTFKLSENKYPRNEMPFIEYEKYVKVLYQSFDCLPSNLRRLCDEWNIEVLQILDFLRQGCTPQQIIDLFNQQKESITPPVVDKRKPKP